MSTAPNTQHDDEKPVKVRRARIDSVDIFEIKDSELDLLEKGSPADLQLNFAIFLFSLAFSAVGTLASTTTFKSDTVKTVFIVVAVVGILVGFILTVSWLRNRTSLRVLCNKIRSRMPPEGVSAPSSLTPPP